MPIRVTLGPDWHLVMAWHGPMAVKRGAAERGPLNHTLTSSHHQCFAAAATDLSLGLRGNIEALNKVWASGS